MPPRVQPKVYQLLLKTHKLTIFLSAPQTASIASLKDDALSALTAKVNTVEDVPTVGSTSDFEICREVKEKGKTTGKFEVMDGREFVKDVLAPWEAIFLRFKDESGRLLPVTFTNPQLVDDDEEEEMIVSRPTAARPIEPTPSSSSKGKRKMSPD